MPTQQTVTLCYQFNKRTYIAAIGEREWLKIIAVAGPEGLAALIARRRRGPAFEAARSVVVGVTIKLFGSGSKSNKGSK